MKVLSLLALGCMSCVISIAATRSQPIIVGWHDEMNGVSSWQPGSTGGIPPKQFSPKEGALTLRLPQTPKGFTYAYQWGGVERVAEVDLSKYPIIVARVGAVKKGSYAHLDIDAFNASGARVNTSRSETLTKPGLIALDLEPKYGNTPKRLEVRLVVGGALKGASVTYDWVRFVGRQELRRLQKHWDLQRVTLQP